jgi:aminotransferase
MTGLRLSDSAARIVQSEIRAMTAECERLGGINLAQGVCDVELPAPVREAAIAAIEAGHNTYTRMEGIARLRDAIGDKLRRHNRIAADPQSQVMVTSGATGAFHAACLALFDPGDEVVVFEPFYGYHVSTLRALRVQPLLLPLASGTWELDLDGLRRAITPRTRGIVINTPGNPSGKVFTRAEIEAVGDIALRHDLFLLSDEIYEYFVYDGARHVSPASIPELADRTITISGLSKTFSITGWRVGYLAADARWLPSIAFFHDLVYVCSPSAAQYGAAAGLIALDDTFYAELAAAYGVKRGMLCDALAAAGLTPAIPDGAYYVLADASRLPGHLATEKARGLLARSGVAAVSGSAFYGHGGDDLLRFCFAKRDSAIADACGRLRALSPHTDVVLS